MCQEGAYVPLLQPVIHIYWAYALARAEEMCVGGQRVGSARRLGQRVRPPRGWMKAA
jgi:hypothetical protein